MSTTFTLHVFALQFWWLLDLCGSEGRIGDGSDNRICGCSLPLSAFFTLLLFHSFRRYVSHPSTRPRHPLTLRWPDGFTIPGLSREMVERLDNARPETLAAAGRIAGITPAALANLLVHARKRESA